MILRMVLCLLLSAPSVAGALPALLDQPRPNPGPSYIPHRVYDSSEKQFSDFEAMAAELARSDVAFVGEQHDDPATHRLELAILEAIARRRTDVLVAMEMFERDVQQALDDYLAGRVSESDFLKAARPWPNYATDYSPLVEFAKAKGWRVIAGNAPRRLASEVARKGLAALDALEAKERRYVATRFDCPKDDYFKRFSETMSAHPGASGAHGGESDRVNIVERYYQAQCIKDETMAESVAAASLDSSGARPLIVHFNGAFHSDYRLGAAARARQRLPRLKVRVVSVIPVDDLDSIKAEDYRKRGDYLIFTLGRAKQQGGQQTNKAL